MSDSTVLCRTRGPHYAHELLRRHLEADVGQGYGFRLEGVIHQRHAVQPYGAGSGAGSAVSRHFSDSRAARTMSWVCRMLAGT